MFGAVEDRLSEETYPATARWDIGGDIGSPPSSYVESSPSTSRSGSSWPSTGDWPSAGIGSEPSTFSASATPGARPKRKPAAASAEISVLELDSSEPTFLEMPTETGEVAELPYTLPPFQSVVELTTAFQPPKQSLSGENVSALRKNSCAPAATVP